MMAARITDMTAHAGSITGPGCPTVLIGKLPAARMGDMHMCPMVTPGTPPVPHGGGPIVDGCPTVLIGKQPAARQGDMCLCVGPPSSIVTGCPTVFIGSGGGGSGGGSKSDPLSRAEVTKALKAGKIKPVEGTESFPLNMQAAFAEVNQHCAPEEVAKKVREIAEAYSKGGGQQEKTELTIRDIAQILEEVEREDGYEAARHFASHLNYGKLTDLAKSFVKGEDDDPDNDPNLMPTRFFLLYGMDDSKIAQMDDHPDRFDGEEHRISVANLRRGLRLLGYDVKEEGEFDDEVWIAFVQFSDINMSMQNKFENTHTVEDGENLGTIAKDYGIASWKYLYEINRETIGDNPDLLKAGSELVIPQWKDTLGDEMIKERGAKLFDYVHGMRYSYVWVPLSITVKDCTNRFLKEKKESYRFTLIDLAQDKEPILCERVFSCCSDVSMLVPYTEYFEKNIEFIEGE